MGEANCLVCWGWGGDGMTKVKIYCESISDFVQTFLKVEWGGVLTTIQTY